MKQNINDSALSLNQSDTVTDDFDNRTLVKLCAELKVNYGLMENKIKILESRVTELEKDSSQMQLTILKLKQQEASNKSSVSDTTNRSGYSEKKNELTVFVDVHKDKYGNRLKGTPNNLGLHQVKSNPKHDNEHDVITFFSDTSSVSDGDGVFCHTRNDRRNILKGRRRIFNLPHKEHSPMPKKDAVQSTPTAAPSRDKFSIKAARQDTHKYQDQGSHATELIYVGRLDTTVDRIRHHLYKIGIKNEDVADVLTLNLQENR